jgi:hypothetical protein
MDPPNQQLVYFDEHSVLVINPKGKIKRLYTPFRVRCIDPLDKIPLNTWVRVDRVTSTEQVPLLYQINGNWYGHDHFSILINF